MRYVPRGSACERRVRAGAFATVRIQRAMRESLRDQEGSHGASFKGYEGLAVVDPAGSVTFDVTPSRLLTKQMIPLATGSNFGSPVNVSE